MKRNYKYLNDSKFLERLDTQRQQTQYVKITLLNWEEKEIEEIQGIISGGTLSVNGDSSVRRTCNLSMIVDERDMKITSPSNLISINKKIFLEIGLKNTTDQYTDYDIIWYPQGTYVVTACSSSHSVSGTTLSINLQDKMCLLNGTCGGVIPASVEFHKYDTIDPETGDKITSYPTIVQIIRELVNHWGGEQLGKIIISDLDERIKIAMRWIGQDPVYAIMKNGNFILTTSKNEAEESGPKFNNTGGTMVGPETPSVNEDGVMIYPSELEIAPDGALRIKSKNYIEYNWGQDVGYTYTDFTYPGELIGNAGDNVCTILDKIKSLLGNYEYFYDVDGNFHFQEIKNYLNITQATTDLEKIKKEDYLVDISKGTAAYSFKDSSLVTSYSNSPNYGNIKNDYVVWGIRETTDGIKVPIRYHLAIDSKPKTGNIYEVFFYADPEDGIIKAKVPVKYKTKNNFPQQGEIGIFYMDTSTQLIYQWDAVAASYILTTNGIVQPYPTKSDFPEKGESGIIYLDDETDTKYNWGLNVTSGHYQEIQSQINELTKQYSSASYDIETQIEDIKNQIADKEDIAEGLSESMKPYLEKIQKAQDEIVEIEDGIVKNNNQADLAQEEYEYSLERQLQVEDAVNRLTQELNELKELNKQTVTGQYIEINNAEDHLVHNISFKGYLKQEGIPSLDNPKPINALKGTVSISANSDSKNSDVKYYLGKDLVFSEDNVDNGVLTKHYGKYILTGEENWQKDGNTFFTTIDSLSPGAGIGYSNYFPNTETEKATVQNNKLSLTIPSKYNITTVKELKDFIIDCIYTKAIPIEIYYPLMEPIQIDVVTTGELQTYNPTTYITVDEDIDVTIVYESNVYTDEINDTQVELTERTAELRKLNEAIAILPSQIQTYLDIIDKLEVDKLVQENLINGYLASLGPKEKELVDLLNELAGLNSQLETLYNNADILLNAFESSKRELSEDQYEYVPTSIIEMEKVQTTDWRSELYLQGAAAEPLGVEYNYYYTELKNEWPKIYDLKKSHYIDENGNIIYTGGFKDEILDNPSTMDYFLDFIDSNAAISQYNINNIGRRTMVENKDDYNCVFEPYIPDYIIIETDQPDTAQKREECIARGQAFIQVEPAIFESLATGGYSNGCFEEVKMLLYNYTGYNESIQLSTVPLYHLDVNKRAEVRDVESDINGDYVINSLSIPLTVGGTMSISATRAVEKL